MDGVKLREVCNTLPDGAIRYRWDVLRAGRQVMHESTVYPGQLALAREQARAFLNGDESLPLLPWTRHV